MGRSKHSGGFWEDFKESVGLGPIKPRGGEKAVQVLKDAGGGKGITKRKPKSKGK